VALNHRWATVGICAFLMISSLALPALGLVQSEFIPNSDTGSISMTLTYHAGTPIGKTSAAVDRLTDAITNLKYVHATLSTSAGSRPVTDRRPAVSLRA